MRRAIAAASLCLLAAGPGHGRAQSAPVQGVIDSTHTSVALPELSSPASHGAATQNGRDIYRRFREGLADPTCKPGVSPRWSTHFVGAPGRLASHNDDLLPLFGYVVDALREASLPTEYALIPFVESGYKPGVRSAAGPAGMWQMIAITARAHKVPIQAGYDGRLSPVDSTRAAVRYLKTLHGMFAGDWRLAAMAYNAGEYRIFGALKRGGQVARDARPEQLPGLPGITQAYVRKIHALACLMEHAEGDERWLQALDRPVPRLQIVEVPDEIDRIATYAARTGQDAAQLQRLNPAFRDGRIRRAGSGPARLLAVADSSAIGAVETMAPVSTITVVNIEAGITGITDTTGATAIDAGKTAADASGLARRLHTVSRGENPWTIAKRYGIRVADLLRHNGLDVNSVLQPGKVLNIDPLLAIDPQSGVSQ